MNKKVVKKFNFKRIIAPMKTVLFEDRDYCNRFWSNDLQETIFINCHLFFPSVAFIIHPKHCPHFTSLYLKWRRNNFCFDYRSGERKTNRTKVPCGDNEINTPSLLSFSFYFLTDIYWSRDHDFQLPAFKVTLSLKQGTRLRACPSEGWMGDEEKEGWWGEKRES